MKERKFGKGPFFVKIHYSSGNCLKIGFKSLEDAKVVQDKFLTVGLLSTDVQLGERIVRIYTPQIEMIEFFRE